MLPGHVQPAGLGAGGQNDRVRCDSDISGLDCERLRFEIDRLDQLWYKCGPEFCGLRMTGGGLTCMLQMEEHAMIA